MGPSVSEQTAKPSRRGRITASERWLALYWVKILESFLHHYWRSFRFFVLCCCRRAIAAANARWKPPTFRRAGHSARPCGRGYEKTGVVKNGDRVEVLEHDRHFSKCAPQPARSDGSSSATWSASRSTIGSEADRGQPEDPVQAQARPATTPTCTSNRDATPNISIRFPRARAVAVKRVRPKSRVRLPGDAGGGDGYSTE